MPITWPELNQRLAALRAAIPRLQADYPDEGDFWDAFAGVAGAIDDCGLDEDQYYYWDVQVSDMLIAAGLQDPGHRQL